MKPVNRIPDVADRQPLDLYEREIKDFLDSGFRYARADLSNTHSSFENLKNVLKTKKYRGTVKLHKRSSGIYFEREEPVYRA